MWPGDSQNVIYFLVKLTDFLPHIAMKCGSPAV